MNHQIPPFNQNVPIMSHTDWGSMAKQWATLRANVNIPPAVNKTESYVYHNIPPPPPPPPTLLPKSNPSYNCDYQDQPYNSNIYEPMPPMVYDDVMISKNNVQCETFDYNHRDRPFVNYNNIHHGYRPIAHQVPHNNSAPFSQNIFNLPPPTHQDYIETSKTSFVPEHMSISTPPKLFPICNVEQYDGIVQNHSQSSMLMSSGNPVISMKQNMTPLFVGHNKFPNQTDYSTNRSNKGLPAWIIDDMKKIKEKERKQPFLNSSDDFRDHPINSKRDEEGDIVMEDVVKDSENDAVISGKSVITTNRIDILTTDIDIDDVNLNDEDDGFDKIDYSSKSLIDLIEMLDESELDNLKIIIIRDSLTAVMKQVTNDMISEVVRSTFTNELSKSTSKSKVGSAPRPSKTVNCINGATVKSVDPPTIDLQMEHSCHLLGLGVYESDDEDVDNVEAKLPDSNDNNPPKSEIRDQWSTHKKSSETTKAIDKKSSHEKDSHKLPSDEKKKSSSDTNSNRNSSPKRKKRSRSRDYVHKRSRSRERHRSPDYRQRSRSKDRRGDGGSSTHKKSKRHNHSPESRSQKWKNDKCDAANNSSKKRNKRDRSRS